MNKEEIIKFKEGLDQLNIYLSEHQYLQFRQFFDMLEEKNKVMNLTAHHRWCGSGTEAFYRQSDHCQIP